MSTQLLLVALFVISMLLMFWNHKKKRKKIIFFGDSITANGSLPNGFIKLIGKNFSKEGILQKYDLVPSGVSGNKIYDLFVRLDSDVMVKDPRVVVVYIGVNDVWHKQIKRTGTDIEIFEKIYQLMIDRLLSVHAKIILVTPAAIGERPVGLNVMDHELDMYCEVVRQLGVQHNCHVVDLRLVFAEYNRQYNPGGQPSGILTTDGVHLTDLGNEVVAHEIWKKLEILLVA